MISFLKKILFWSLWVVVAYAVILFATLVIGVVAMTQMFTTLSQEFFLQAKEHSKRL